MTPRQTTWEEIQPGMYLSGPESQVWRVEDMRGLARLLQNGAGEKTVVTVANDRPVTVLEPTDAEAVAVVERTLGAEVLAEMAPGKVMRCPPLTSSLDVMHMHMKMIHGYVCDSGPGSKTVLRLQEFHREDHDLNTARSHAWVPHEHHRRKA